MQNSFLEHVKSFSQCFENTYVAHKGNPGLVWTGLTDKQMSEQCSGKRGLHVPSWCYIPIKQSTIFSFINVVVITSNIIYDVDMYEN